LYLADEFRLANNVTISIDNVSLIISYTIFEPNPIIERIDYTWIIYALLIGVVSIITAFTLYQTHYKYPPLVRKIRKLRKKVRKGKKTKPILAKERQESIKTKYMDYLKSVKLEILEDKNLKLNSNKKKGDK
jgi:hypothetical protein